MKALLSTAIPALVFCVPIGYCLWFIGSGVQLVCARGLKALPELWRRSSLRVALFLWAFELSTLPFCFSITPHAERTWLEVVYLTGSVYILVPACCVLAWLNLIRDVERGYSPSRCSLAAVLLLIASTPPVLVAAYLLMTIALRF